MAVHKLCSLFVVAGLLASTFSFASAFDRAPLDGSSGIENFHSGTFSEKRNTPAPPAVGPAPGLFKVKPRNSPAPPAVGPAPGLFNLKPRNTPAPPAVGPAPGLFNLKPGNTPAPPASFTINNIIDGEVSVHCYSSQRDLPNRVVSPVAPFFTIDIQEDLTANIPWMCEFSVLDGTQSLAFPVWTHDGTPFLSECDQCFWKVQGDGFWIWSATQQTDIHMHSWNINT